MATVVPPPPSLSLPHSAPISPITAHPHHHHPRPRTLHTSHPPTPPHSSPSSPSSTHSSSSAIFERDIEPLSLSLSPAPRDHTLSALVPNVLDEAVEALTQSDGQETVEVEVAGPPDPQQFGGRASRCPSPPGIPVSGTERHSGLYGAPMTPPSMPPSPPVRQLEIIPGITPAPVVGRPVSGSHATASKRLSFLSYSDLLLSSPVTSMPLSQVTSPPHPPPHLFAPAQAFTPLARSREASTYGDEGGEWEREGLGRGLDERLEEVLRDSETPRPQA